MGWMNQLKRNAAELALEFDLHAGTDITGFGFLGHVWEMAEGAHMGMQLQFDQMPFISCAKKHAAAWRFLGGAYDNKAYYEKHIQFDPAIPEEYQFLLYDAQTSGGLAKS